MHNPAAKFRASTVLDKIKDSWLIEEEIFLCGKEKLHTQALRKLIRESKYDMAEEYCASKSEGLLTTLFELYVGFYEESKKKVIYIFIYYIVLHRFNKLKERTKIWIYFINFLKIEYKISSKNMQHIHN